MPGVEEFNSDIKVFGTVNATYVVKQNSSDSYVLLGGGGHALASSFAFTNGIVSNSSFTGLQNGVNKKFVLPYAFMSNSTRVYLNGLRQKIGSGNDYIETDGNTVEFIDAPLDTDSIIIDYLKQ